MRNVIFCAVSITESKLDTSLLNAEVNINGYNIIRNDRNKNSEGVVCCYRNDLCFNIQNIFSTSIKHAFFEIIIPKFTAIAI